MTAVEKVDWFCPKCNSYVSSESVTFEETHQICNTGVILEPLNQNKMEQTAVEWLEMEIQKSIIPAQKDYFKWAFEQAKEMEEEQIVTAHYQGYRSVIGTTEVSEQYYNETFKSE